jgi:hypothetical protein
MGRWTRHLAAWGAAGVLLALLAGGGLWLYEQSQVEGALVVVANTNPAPAPVARRAPAPAWYWQPVLAAAPGLPAVAPVSSSVRHAGRGSRAADRRRPHNSRGVGLWRRTGAARGTGKGT